MKRLLNYALLLMALTFLISCEKEPKTDLEIIENQLKDFVSDNGITKCSIILMYGETAYTKYENVDFSISKGFVVIKSSANGEEYQDRYNLLYLSKYRLTIDKNLGLYFANTHY